MKQFDISKTTFSKILKQLMNANDLKNEVDDLIMEYAPEGHDFMSGSGLSIDHECAVVELLELLTHDDADDIGWWCWEANYGRRPDFTISINGQDVDLSTPEKLYDYLLDRYNDSKDGGA